MIAVNRCRAKGTEAAAKKDTGIMGVIGRLDEQVDDVLIKPLAKRNTRAEAHALDSGADETLSRARQPPQALSVRGNSARDQAKREELPVWLL